MQSGWELCEDRLSLVALGREPEGQQPGSLCWVLLPHHGHYLSWVEHSPLYGISWGECSNPTLWTPCCPTLQSSCPAEESAARARCRCLCRFRGCQWLSCVALGQAGDIPPTFMWIWLVAPPLQGRSHSLILQALGGFTLLTTSCPLCWAQTPGKI